MDATAQPELFGGLFADRELSRRRTVRARLMELTEEHGPMVPQNIMPVYLDVSRSRVAEMIRLGTLPAFEVGGKNFVPMVAIELWRDGERKAGRPVEELTLRESYRRHLTPHWEALKKTLKNNR